MACRVARKKQWFTGRRKLSKGGMAEHFEYLINIIRNCTDYVDLRRRYNFFHINGSVRLPRWEG